MRHQKQKMRRITIARGDGIGPEIMEATLAVIKAAGAQLEFDEIEIGEALITLDTKHEIVLEALLEIFQEEETEH